MEDKGIGRVLATMDNSKIAKKLLELRGDRTRREVSKAVGISINTLQMYETGKRIPKDDIKIQLANYYGRSVQEIFFD